MKLKKLGKNDFIIISLLGVMLLVVAIPSNSGKTVASIEKTESGLESDEQKLKSTNAFLNKQEWPEEVQTLPPFFMDSTRFLMNRFR